MSHLKVCTFKELPLDVYVQRQYAFVSVQKIRGNEKGEG